MPAYAVGIVPLLTISLSRPENEEDRTFKFAYADDLAGGGKIVNLRSWWDKLLEKGPPLGYFPKASEVLAGCQRVKARRGKGSVPWYRY